ASGAERVLVPKVTRDEQEGFTAMDVWPNYAISRDGRTIFFCNHGKLARVDVASGNVTNIPFTADVEQWLAQRVAFQDRVESGPLHARILRWTSIGRCEDGRIRCVRPRLGAVDRERQGGRRAAASHAR